MLFSERYSDLIDVGHGEPVDKICSDIDNATKVELAEIMREFAEPQKVSTNRYDSYYINTTALESAIQLFNDKKHGPYIWFENSDFDNAWSNPLAVTFTPFLFDVIELQYEELSDGEKEEFQAAINTVFRQHDMPWLLCEGHLIKMDATQFELDLRQKTLERMRELKDSEPKFQPAYEELLESCEFFEKGSFAAAISNAEKSYESVLKVICGVQKGNADQLTQTYINENSGALPITMRPDGFREKVLMSLPFIRNNSASDHGAGAVPVVIDQNLATLAINLSAALNTYLIGEYRKNTEICSQNISSDDINELPF